MKSMNSGTWPSSERKMRYTHIMFRARNCTEKSVVTSQCFFITVSFWTSIVIFLCINFSFCVMEIKHSHSYKLLIDLWNFLILLLIKVGLNIVIFPRTYFSEVLDFPFISSYWAELFFIISKESLMFSAHFNIRAILILIIECLL